jgi:hypothetical protein
METTSRILQLVEKTSFILLRDQMIGVDNRPVPVNTSRVFDGVFNPRGDITVSGDAGVTITVDAELFINFRLDFDYTDIIISTTNGTRWKFIKDFDYGSEMTFWLARGTMK